MLKYIRQHPLAAVLILAILVRVVAVIFSKGYMASDDQYETIDVAYHWLRNGLFADNGLLVWGPYQEPGYFARFPLYTLSLYFIMYLYKLCGIVSLDSIMYGIRACHALLSLISVWAVFKIVEQVTKSKNWALIAGLMVALHLAMSFLAVRNLIEMVSGHFWILSIYFLYRYREKPEDRWLYISGMIAGLAWLIRFEIIAAFAAVPFILWYDYKKISPAIKYSLALAGIILLSGFVDGRLSGQFMGSTIKHVTQIFTEHPPYKTSILIYPAVILAFFVPPFSLVGFFLAGYKRFWSQHKIIVITSLVFIIAHTLSSSRQERYMIPIIPVLFVILILAFYYHKQSGGWLFRHRTVLHLVIWPSVALNFIFLIIFTFNYGHKGLVEPLAWMEKQKPGAMVVFVSPEIGQIYPNNYGGLEPIKPAYIRKWDEMRFFEEIPHIKTEADFYILYPPKPESLPAYRDSLIARVGPVTEVKAIHPSTLDTILHYLNPDHNPLQSAYIFKRRNS